MYAIVEIAGQQFKVERGVKVYVHRLDANEGSKVNFDKVLLVDNGGKVQVGPPSIDGATVAATVSHHHPPPKNIVPANKRTNSTKSSKPPPLPIITNNHTTTTTTLETNHHHHYTNIDDDRNVSSWKHGCKKSFRESAIHLMKQIHTITINVTEDCIYESTHHILHQVRRG